MVFDANGTMIRVAKVQPDYKPPIFTILGWQVTNIESVVSEMTEKGVVFERYGFFEQDTLGIWAAPVRTEKHQALYAFLGRWRAEGESYGNPRQGDFIASSPEANERPGGSPS